MNTSIAKIKFITAATFMACLTTTSTAAVEESFIRGSGEKLQGRALNEKGCVFMIREDVALKGVTIEEPFYECLLEDGTTADLIMDKDQKKEIKTMIENGDAMPGESVLESTGAMVTEAGIIVPKGEKFLPPIDMERRSRRNLVTKEGNTYFLVVRVIDKNGLAHPHNTEKMSDKTFGTDGDPVNLKSQIYDCSGGKLNIVPGYPDSATQQQKDAIDAVTVNMGHPPGLMEATIDINIKNHAGGRSVVKNAAIQKVNSLLGFTLPGPFDHVVFNLERCYIDCGWAAYAAVNSWYQVYQGNYYLDTGTTVHEYGHNLGMAHSGGLNGGFYGDHTCQMGDPIYSDNNAKMCFNPAKSYYIGWYDEGIELFDPAVEDQWTGTLMGVGQWKDYEASYPVVVKIESGTNTDYFVGFNRAAGANSDNDEADDLVTIIETGNNGETYSQSWLKGYIGAGQSYTFNNWQGGTQDVVISVESIDLESNPGTATISISLVGTRSPTVAPTPLPGCTTDTVMIDVTTDNYPEETSWIIENSQGVIQASSSAYNHVGAQDQYKGCHDACGGNFKIKDSYGDGMCCSYGSGSYSLQVNGRTIITTEGSFNHEEMTPITCETLSPTAAPPTLAPTTASPTTPAPTTPAPTTAAPTSTPTAAPVPPTDAPTRWGDEELFAEDFNGATNKFTGGTLNTNVNFVLTGSKSYRIRNTERAISSSIDIIGFSDLKVDFSYYASSMESTDKFFFEYSFDGSSSWTVPEGGSWTSVVNNAWISESIMFETNGNGEVFIRFRGGGNKNNDAVFFDEIIISGKLAPPSFAPTLAPIAPVTPTDAPTQWGEMILEEDFEETNIFSGGQLSSTFALAGSRSYRIRKKNIAKSSAIDIAGYSDVKVDFYYYGVSMERTDKFFFEYSFDGSSSWTVPEGGSWTRRRNNAWFAESVMFETNGNGEVFIRFRGDMNARNELIYLDAITVSGQLTSGSSETVIASSKGTEVAEILFNEGFEDGRGIFQGSKGVLSTFFSHGEGTKSLFVKKNLSAQTQFFVVDGYSNIIFTFFFSGTWGGFWRCI